jgi:hypothetical protein
MNASLFDEISHTKTTGNPHRPPPRRRHSTYQSAVQPQVATECSQYRGRLPGCADARSGAGESPPSSVHRTGQWRRDRRSLVLLFVFQLSLFFLREQRFLLWLSLAFVLTSFIAHRCFSDSGK